MAKLFVAKSFVAESFVAKLDMAGKSVAESIMAKILSIRLRINVTLVCFYVRSFGTELESLLLFQCVHFSHTD